MIEVKSPPKLPQYPTTIKEICSRADKMGRYTGKPFYYCEIENNYLKIFRVDIKQRKKEYETKDAVMVREVKKSDYKYFDKYWMKIDLCNFILAFKDKKDYYNKKYYRMFWVPLYLQNGYTNPFFKTGHKSDYRKDRKIK